MTLQTITFPKQANTPPVSGRSNQYVLILRNHLQPTDVARLLHYVSDFGRGDARGHELDGGWCIKLSDMADVKLLTSQCEDQFEELAIEQGTGKGRSRKWKARAWTR